MGVWFRHQFEQSNIISGCLALAIWGAVIYLAIAQIDIPEILYFGGSAVVGFFFGTKQGHTEAERAYLVDVMRERRHRDGQGL